MRAHLQRIVESTISILIIMCLVVYGCWLAAVPYFWFSRQIERTHSEVLSIKRTVNQIKTDIEENLM